MDILAFPNSKDEHFHLLMILKCPYWTSYLRITSIKIRHLALQISETTWNMLLEHSCWCTIVEWTVNLWSFNYITVIVFSIWKLFPNQRRNTVIIPKTSTIVSSVLPPHDMKPKENNNRPQRKIFITNRLLYLWNSLISDRIWNV